MYESISDETKKHGASVDGVPANMNYLFFNLECFKYVTNIFEEFNVPIFNPT